MIKVPLAEVKDELSDYVKKAAKDEVLITRPGKPAAILIGFADEDRWFDCRPEREERFPKRIEGARRQARTRALVRLERLSDKR